jgi:tRNA U34 5-carboxymethylaminomethyl modifying GTPase MnmE/TrmE
MTSHDAADTIVAISTPLGEAGIGIVRLSGPAAELIARRLFRITPAVSGGPTGSIWAISSTPRVTSLMRSCSA